MEKKYVLFILFVFTSIIANAFHIAGGDLTTKWLVGNTFDIQLTLYRDCSNPNGAQFDASINLAIYDKGTNLLATSVILTLDQSSITPIVLSGNGCSPPPSVCLESGNYHETIIIPDNPNGYYLVWERCCRNNTIINIVSPQSTGLAFYAEIPDPALHNSSPVFNSPPAPYTCEMQFFQFGFQATDADGDSLVYELSDPLDGGHTSTGNSNPFANGSGGGQIPLPAPFTHVIWQNSYGLTNICGGTQPLVINSSNGLVQGTPDNIGIYAMAVTVSEYRNGILIGLVRREIEFTSISCSGNTAPNISPSIANKDYEIYATDTLCFDVTATDINGDSIYLIHAGEVFENTNLTTISAPYALSKDTSGLDSIFTTFCWTPSCDQTKDSAYLVTYTIRDNGCPLALAVNGNFRIKVDHMKIIDRPNLLCLHFESNDVIKIVKAPDNTINARYFKGYTIYRSVNNSPFSPIKIIADPFTNIFYDSSAIDNKNNNYCYVITGVNNCNIQSINSDTLCSDNAFNANKNYIESVSVESNNAIKMKWEQFADGFFSTYFIYRKINSPNATFEKIIDLKNYPSFEWKDDSVHTSQNSYCYKMMNEDVCGNFSNVSDEACTILLNGKADFFIDKLNWNSYINWRGSVASYNTERSDVNINIPYRQIIVIPFADTIAEDRNLPSNGGVFNYRIRAIEGIGGKNAESISNEIELIQAPAIYLPNAFSPNIDTKNELWGAESVFVKTYNLVLYNRWGQLIFKTDSTQEKWDGNFKGSELPEGIYIYKVQFSGYNSNKVFEKTGSVTLIR